MCVFKISDVKIYLIFFIIYLAVIMARISVMASAAWVVPGQVSNISNNITYYGAKYKWREIYIARIYGANYSANICNGIRSMGCTRTG